MRTRAHPRLPASRRMGNAAGLPPSSVDLTLGVEGYYALDDNLNDSSPNARNLTDAGAIYAACKINNGLVGGGGSRTGLGLSLGAISIAAWVRRAVSHASVVFVVQLLDVGAVNVVARLTVSNLGAGSLSANYNAGAVTLAGGTTPVGSWRHMVLTVGPAGGVLYVDGVVANSDGTALDSYTTDELLLSTTSRTHGDEVAIYSRVLSQADVTALYNGGAGRNPYA